MNYEYINMQSIVIADTLTSKELSVAVVTVNLTQAQQEYSKNEAGLKPVKQPKHFPGKIRYLLNNLD